MKFGAEQRWLLRFFVASGVLAWCRKKRDASTSETIIRLRAKFINEPVIKSLVQLLYLSVQ